MTTGTQRTFNQSWSMIQKLIVAVKKHSRQSEQSLRLLKKSFYKLAVEVGRAMGMPEFIPMLKSIQGCDPKRPVDWWLDQVFAPMKLIGESYHDLMRLIQDGATIKEYVEQDTKLILSRKAKEKREARGQRLEVAMPDETPDDIPVSEQLAAAKQNERTLRGMVKELRSENASLRRENHELSGRLSQIESALRPFEKKLLKAIGK